MTRALRGLIAGLALAAGGLVPACALKPPVENSGALAKDGVQVAVRFMTRGGMSCTKPMVLDADAGITAGAAPVQIGAVTFLPSKA